ncbi:MAG TPA: DSD1 family PLP-dependent enzyme [Gemmataceae bacterium]
MQTLAVTPQPGQPPEELDTPQVLIDLDVADANLRRMFAAARRYGVAVRVHFKSLKCTGLAKHIAAAGADGFLCAKLSEAEVLADAGLTDILIANQVVGPLKLRRLAELAKRASLRVCVDDPDNVAAIGRAAGEAGATLGVLVEVDVGMRRCGVEPGGPVLELARHVARFPSLRFDGLQGYDGHLQQVRDPAEREQRCREGMRRLTETRKLLEGAGVPVRVVTGGGTGTWEFVASTPGVTEIQPGSFVLMDCTYREVRPEFGCALSVLTTVISRRENWYVLDAGSKAISQDFGKPVIKGRPGDRVLFLAEEHTKVETDDGTVRVGDRVEVIPSHCCATMNLHRRCVAVRGGRVGHVWPIEASGRYD